MSSTQSKSTRAGAALLSSTANSGAEQESSLVTLSFPIHTLPVPASFSGFRTHRKPCFVSTSFRPHPRSVGPRVRPGSYYYHDPQSRVQRDDVYQDMMVLLLDVTYRLLWQDEIATLPRWYYTFPARKPTALPLECEKWSRSANTVVLHVNLRPTCAVAHI